MDVPKNKDKQRETISKQIEEYLEKKEIQKVETGKITGTKKPYTNISRDSRLSKDLLH